MLAALEVELPRVAAPRASESRAHRDDDEPAEAEQELLTSGETGPPAFLRSHVDWVTPERAVTASWLVNWLLFIFKAVAFISSNSKAVLAALADSAGAPFCFCPSRRPVVALLFALHVA